MNFEIETYRKLIAYLRNFISEDRFERINSILDQRTDHLTIVLEDLHKSHNANAVLRSCEGFGIQDVHIIENRNTFDEASTVSIGAHNWLSLHRYNDVTECFQKLKSEGYKIIATTPHEKDTELSELDITEKTALVFGTELEGVSENVINQADGFIRIPMYGFSESFNISVSAAICMHSFTQELRTSDVNWSLTEAYKTQLRFQWIKKTIKAGDQLVEKFLKENGID